MNIFTKAITTLARNMGLLDPRLYAVVSAGATYAGENVTVDSAMNLDTVYACVTTITETIATLPCRVFRIDENDNGMIAKDHNLYRILHDSPNADMTSVNFLEVIVSSLLLWGNSYVVIERLGGRIVALTPLRPDRVQVRVTADATIEYTYNYAGRYHRFNEDEILHIKGFSLDGIAGISPVSQLRQVVGTAIATEKSAGSFFKNGMQPSTVMKAPTYLTTDQRKQANVVLEKYSGAVNSGKTPLLEGGWDIHQLSLKPEDSQLLESRSFSVPQLCRIFRMPPPIIGHTEKESAWGPAREQIMIWYLTLCIRPLLERIEQAMEKALFTAAEKSEFYIEFNFEGLLRADSAGRAALYASAGQNGWMKRNEIRKKENLPPEPGGDKLTVQSNLIPIDMLGKTPATQDASPKVDVVPPIGQ